MHKLTQIEAQQAALLHSNNNTVTAEQVKQLLANASVTFAQITYLTKVPVAAAHKLQNIQKVTSANVILCSNIKAHTSVYANKVKRSAASIPENDPAAVAAFKPQANYFVHTECHSIVQHREDAAKQYLYVIYNNASSLYLHNGKVVKLQDIAQYLTPSGYKEQANTDLTVRNIGQGITHRVCVRTIALSNIVSIRARKQLLTV